MHSSDVVVVGIGMAGLAAAMTAHDAGAEVIVLEKMLAEHAGGNSRVSGQVWFCPTDVELAKAHLRELAWEYPIPDPIVDAWATETGRNSDWVQARAEEVVGRVPRDDGDPFTGDHTELVRRSQGEELARLGWPDQPEYEFPEIAANECGVEYNYIGGSQGYSRLWLTLKTAFDERGIDVHYGTRATALLRDGSGEVTGVSALGPDGEPLTFAARRGVVLASGGFANNSEMARNFLRLSYVTPWGSPGNTGDGIRMAQKLGADLVHPYNYMAMPGIKLPPYENGEFAQPAEGRFIYVGADGRRFVDETLQTRHGKIRTRGMFDFHPGVPMWTIFDENARLAGPIVWPRETYAACWMKQIERYSWSADNSAEIERGWIVRGSTLGELAEKLEIDAEGLQAEIARYNAWAERAEDDPMHGRPAATMTPIARGPFYGYRWAQLLITTLGGVRKDEHGRVLDPSGQPISRLYCAGDVASTYTWMLSGGMGLGDAMAFGRISGRQVVQEPPLDESALDGAGGVVA
jgi:glycine/D-amino acid oxidase-like deaminating enzyme